MNPDNSDRPLRPWIDDCITSVTVDITGRNTDGTETRFVKIIFQFFGREFMVFDAGLKPLRKRLYPPDVSCETLETWLEVDADTLDNCLHVLNILEAGILIPQPKIT